MKVGLPGVGIGGVFYLILVAWMPFHELWRTLHGRSSPARWRVVGTQSGLGLAIIAALGGEWWLLTELPGLAQAGAELLGLGGQMLVVHSAEAAPVVLVAGLEMEPVQLEYLAPAVVATPFAVILGILLGLRLLRLCVRRRGG